MSNKINWDDGSFEFIDEDALKKLDTKKYSVTSTPLSSCKFCTHKQCQSYVTKATEASQFVYDKYFNEDTDNEDIVLSTLENLPKDISGELGLTDANLATCFILHILQKIDEETMVEVNDALIHKALSVVLK